MTATQVAAATDTASLRKSLQGALAFPITPFAGDVAAIVANYGASARALLDVLLGDARPEGSLPFDLPSSMAAVEANRPDVPFDTADSLFRFGHGLRYAD